METVEVLVRIPKEEYDYMIANPTRYNVCDDETLLYNHIKNGTVLPKGHGRLIDAVNLKGKFHIECYTECGVCPYHKDGNCGLIDVAVPTVIEADREEGNEKH